MGMTDRDKKLMAIFAVIVVLGGFWFLVLGKKKSALAEAQQAKTAAQQELETAKAAEEVGKQEKKRYPVSYSRVIRLGKAIPADSDHASFLVQVNDAAEAAGVFFQSLTSSDGVDSATPVAAPGASGPTGTPTTCDQSSAGNTATGGPSSGTGSTGSTANTGLGRAVDNSQVAAGEASNDAEKAANADLDEKCAESPTLTDLAAQTAGLRLRNYSFKFKGSFFKLHDVIGRLLHAVETRNGKIKVTGRLLQIKTIKLSTDSFPDLSADVEMTGYVLPDETSLTAGAAPSGPAGAPTPVPAPATSPAQ